MSILYRLQESQPEPQGHEQGASADALKEEITAQSFYLVSKNMVHLNAKSFARVRKCEIASCRRCS